MELIRFLKSSFKKSSKPEDGIPEFTQIPPLQSPSIPGANWKRHNLPGDAPPYDDVRRHHLRITSVNIRVHVTKPPTSSHIILRNSHRNGALFIALDLFPLRFRRFQRRIAAHNINLVALVEYNFRFFEFFLGHGNYDFAVECESEREREGEKNDVKKGEGFCRLWNEWLNLKP